MDIRNKTKLGRYYDSAPVLFVYIRKKRMPYEKYST